MEEGHPISDDYLLGWDYENSEHKMLAFLHILVRGYTTREICESYVGEGTPEIVPQSDLSVVFKEM